MKQEENSGRIADQMEKTFSPKEWDDMIEIMKRENCVSIKLPEQLTHWNYSDIEYRFRQQGYVIVGTVNGNHKEKRKYYERVYLILNSIGQIRIEKIPKPVLFK